MATAFDLISVIGTAVTVLSFFLTLEENHDNDARVKYIIANDGAHGHLTAAGGGLPDLRMFDETAEFLGAAYDPGTCDEGSTICKTYVNTPEAVTYTLFTGNDNAICIPWVGLTWAGGQRDFGFHPGQWAHACDAGGYGTDGWWCVYPGDHRDLILTIARYYAGQVVPGIKEKDEVYCAWIDKNGDVPTTGFQVHWPEFDKNVSPKNNLGYYCNSRPPVNFVTDYEPRGIYYWEPNEDRLAISGVSDTTPAVRKTNATEPGPSKSQGRRRSNPPMGDTRIVKSHFPVHRATELCDPTLKAAGPSFVSYAEKQFCYMTTKDLFPFCDTIDSGTCWSDEANKVVVQNGEESIVADFSLPDLSHVKDIVVWGNSSAEQGA